MTAKQQANLLALIGQGKPLRGAARAVGLEPTEVEDAIASDPDFAHDVEEAQAYARERVEEALDRSLYDKAVKGDARAAGQWLRRRGKE